MDTTAHTATESVPAETPGHDSVSTASVTPHIVEELLVEEISIDGMCGVY